MGIFGALLLCFVVMAIDSCCKANKDSKKYELDKKKRRAKQKEALQIQTRLYLDAQMHKTVDGERVSSAKMGFGHAIELGKTKFSNDTVLSGEKVQSDNSFTKNAPKKTTNDSTYI